MSELKQAIAQVEVIEHLLARLLDSLQGNCHVEVETRRSDFEEIPGGTDWVFVDEVLLLRDQGFEEQRKMFVEVQTYLRDFKKVEEKMRRKCQACKELEAIKSQLRRYVPAGSKDVLTTAQSMVMSGECDGEVKQLLNRATCLHRSLTYGEKTFEEVFNLLARFDAVQAIFDTDVVPLVGESVAAAEASEHKHRSICQRREAALLEEESQRAQREAVKPLRKLLQENEERLQMQHDASEWRYVDLPLPCSVNASRASQSICSLRDTMFS